MAATITAGTFTAAGKTYEPILRVLIFQNATLNDKLVTFADDIKASTEVTEVDASVTMQAYTSGAPSSAGGQTSTGTVISPVKVMYYNEFDPESLRFSRYGRDMTKGAWNLNLGEFETVVLDLYGGKVSQDAELKWYNNALSGTKTAVAAGANTAAEKAYVASLSSGLFDGLITRIIYNGGAVGGRINVVGTTISATNILTEYTKLYSAIPSVVLQNNDEDVRIYAPYSHIQFINNYNITPTNYTKPFFVPEKGKPGQGVRFQNLEVVFTQMPENCMLAALPSHLMWATDLASDIAMLKIDKINNNREDYFVKNIFTIFAHVMLQSTNVLYL